jgi:DNA-directed RNA polymerase subunit RPC12/RpoP
VANEQQRNSAPKRKAMQKVRDDVRRGKTSKPSKCSSCGKTAKQLNFHHTAGYGKSAQKTGKWLCPSCHARIDKKMNHGGKHRN